MIWNRHHNWSNFYGSRFSPESTDYDQNARVEDLPTYSTSTYYDQQQQFFETPVVPPVQPVPLVPSFRTTNGSELRHYTMSLRRILSDNIIRDIQDEEDSLIFATLTMIRHNIPISIPQYYSENGQLWSMKIIRK